MTSVAIGGLSEYRGASDELPVAHPIALSASGALGPAASAFLLSEVKSEHSQIS